MTTNPTHDAAPICSCVTQFGTIDAETHEWLLDLEAQGFRAVVQLMDWCDRTQLQPAGKFDVVELGAFYLAHADRLVDAEGLADMANGLCDYAFYRQLADERADAIHAAIAASRALTAEVERLAGCVDEAR